jgi:putative DNA primase/helicase
MKTRDPNDILRELGPDGVVRAFDAAEEIKPRARGNGAEKPSKQIRITMGADIKPQAIDWLWPDWLAHGKLHVLAGRPGTLKTTAVLSFAATITIGGQWPDCSRAALGKVVMWSGEDAIDDTLLPRFLAAGGDRSKIGFVSGVEEEGRTRSFDPARDMDDLIVVRHDLGPISLVIIDPIVAVAKGDSHKNAEARRDLQPLVDLAERTHAAVLGVHHLTKRSEGADPVDRVAGSLAFGAGPRVVMLSALEGNAAGEARGRSHAGEK